MTDQELREKTELLAALISFDIMSTSSTQFMYSQSLTFPLMARIRQKIANLRTEIINALPQNIAEKTIAPPDR